MTRSLTLGLRSLTLGLLVALAGCGYRAGLLMPEGTRTIGVEVFDNVSKQRDVEAEVHDALTASLRSRLDARIVSPADADLVIRGSVTDYRRRSGIRTKGNVLQETGVTIELTVKLVRRLQSNGPTPRESVLSTIELDDESGYRLGEPRGELDARGRALRRLADRAVLDLFSGAVYERPAANP